MPRALLTLLFSALPLFGSAQVSLDTPASTTGEVLCADTLSAAPAADSVKRGFFRRVIDYFDQATEDRTTDKRIDFTFAGGPSYSKTTGLGLGVLGSGLYRLDRTDTLTAPSDLSIYANVATSGFYSVGVTGNTLFRQSRRRMYYDLSFSSSPRDVWGIGYRAGRQHDPTEIVEQRYAVRVHFQQRLLDNTYLGALLDFDYTRGRKFDAQAEAYIDHQRHHYTATGLGVSIEYDSRDFIPNPSRGIYASVQQLFYAKGLGSCEESLWRTIAQLDLYKQLWKSGLIAFDLYSEFNSAGTPWTLLARLGGEERMRGYYEGQYTDRNLISCQVELRQHLWRRFGCVVWGGAGNVFPTVDRFRWRETLPNYGLGLRWELKHRVNVRMDYGFGRSTSGFLLSINEAF